MTPTQHTVAGNFTPYQPVVTGELDRASFGDQALVMETLANVEGNLRHLGVITSGMVQGQEKLINSDLVSETRIDRVQMELGKSDVAGRTPGDTIMAPMLQGTLKNLVEKFHTIGARSKLVIQFVKSTKKS